MYHELQELWKDLLQVGLKEDGWPWDWTTLGTRKNNQQQIHARVIAKSDGIWAAESLAFSLNEIAKTLRVQSNLHDGNQFSPGDLLVEIQGLAYEVLAFERPFLNLASYSSGISTATSRLVTLVGTACPDRTPRVTLTRKTLPGYREISIHSVRVGGGFPHRVSLSGGVLIKENHIAAAGSIHRAVQGVHQISPHGLKIEVEVRNESELAEAVQAGAEGVLLDNFSPKQVKEALHYLEKQENRLFVEVSGGLSEETIAAFAIPGVDILSVGSLTHSVKAADFSLLVD